MSKVIIPDDIQKLLDKHHAIPAEGQTEDDFKKEELSKDPATSMDIFSKIAPYLILRGAFPSERIKGWSVEDKIRKTLNDLDSNPSDDVVKMSEPEKNSSTDEKVETMLPTDLDVVPEVKLPSEKFQLLSTSSFGKMKWNYNVVKSKKEPTFIKYEPVGRKEDKEFVVWHTLPQIGEFSTIKEFIIQRENLIDAIFFLVPMIAGQDEKIDPMHEYWEHTVDEQVGVKITKEFLSMVENPTNFRNKMRQFPKQSSRRRTRKRYYSFTDEITIELAKIKERYYNLPEKLTMAVNHYEAIRQYHDQVLSANEYYLMEIPDSFVRGYTAFHRPYPSPTIYRKLMDESPVLREYAINAIKDDLIPRVMADTKIDRTLNYEKILTGLQAALMVALPKLKVPARLSSLSPEHLIRTMVLAMTMPKYVRIDMHPKHYTEFDIVDVTACVCAHIFLPEWTMDTETIRRINNYLFFNLFYFTKDMNTAVPLAQFNDQVDYLKEKYGSIKDRDLRIATGNFLVSQGGFSDRRGGKRDLPEVAGQLLGRSTFYYYPYETMLSKDTRTTRQFAYFEAFLHALERVRWPEAFRNNGRDIIYMLRMVYKRFNVLTRNCYMIEQMVKTLSASGYAAPLSHIEYDNLKSVIYPPAPKLRRVPITINMDYLPSYAITGEFQGEKVPSLKLDQIFDFHYLCGWLNEVSQRYDYAKRYLKKESEPNYDTPLTLFTRQDRYAYAFDQKWMEFQAPTSLKNELIAQLNERYGYGHALPEPVEDNKLLAARQEVRAILEKYPTYFGFTREWVITRHPTQKLTRQGIRYYVFDENHLYGEDTFGFLTSPVRLRPEVWKLSDILRMARRQNFHDVMKRLVESATPIKVILPMKITKKKFFENPNAEQTLPISMTQHETLVKLGSFNVYYDQTQEYRYVEFHKPQLLKLPWIVLESTRDICHNVDPEEYLLSRMTFQQRVTQNVNIVMDWRTLFPTTYHAM
jgi:hypothetical protein